MRSSLGQNFTVTSLESSALLSSSGGCGNSGGGCTSGRGDRKCDHCGGLNHTKPYCWVKYGKTDYANQVVDGGVQPQPSSAPLGHTTSRSDSRDAHTTQLSELVQQLHTTSVATLADLGNVA